MNEPELYQQGKLSDPFYIEYIKRSSPFSMPADHFHPFYEMYYLVSGKRTYFIKDASYAIQQGDLVFIGKNEVHKTMQAGGPSHERIVVHFDDRFIHAVSERHAKLLLSPFHQSSHVLRLPPELQAAVHSHMSRLLTEMRETPWASDLYARHAIVDVLLLAARYVQQHAPVNLSQATPMHRKISDIVRYLNGHYAEPVQLSDLSEMFYISPSHLSRTFKEVTGFSFVDYVNLNRIREAQRLLRETDMPITEIAANVGFDNFSHFGKTFKKITRTSARAYRKENSLSSLS